MLIYLYCFHVKTFNDNASQCTPSARFPLVRIKSSVVYRKITILYSCKCYSSTIVFTCKCAIYMYFFRILFPRYHIPSLKVWESYYAKAKLEVFVQSCKLKCIQWLLLIIQFRSSGRATTSEAYCKRTTQASRRFMCSKI